MGVCEYGGVGVRRDSDMSTKYRTAIIGTGRIANTHAGAYTRHGGIDLVAGVDVNAETLETFRERWNVPQGFSDYEEMLKEVRPDLVSICTYADLHWPMFKASVEAGAKGIICEKPMFNSPSELPLVRALVEESGVKVAIGHMRRYGMAHQRAREILESGELGEPTLAMGMLSGGGLAEMGSHWIDLLRYILGDIEVESVLAQTNVHDTITCGHAQEDDAVLHMSFAGDIEGIFLSGQRTLKNNVLTMITCTQGSIQVLGEDDLVVAAPSGVRTEELMNEQPEIWKSFGRELPQPWWDYKWDILMHEYVNWIDGGDPPEVGFENAIKATEIYMAGYLSAIRREKIDLPLAGELLELNEWPGNVLARLGEER